MKHKQAARITAEFNSRLQKKDTFYTENAKVVI
jgi:hypothetical protein